MSRTIAESELLYEQVKGFFWRPPEADFIVRISAAPMNEWEVIPTSSEDEMISIRCRLESEFAGYIRHEGRYCFYFVDLNIVKVQYLDNGEIDCFHVRGFHEFDLATVAKELRMLQGS